MPPCQSLEVSSAWQRLPKNTQLGQRCKNARDGRVPIDPLALLFSLPATVNQPPKSPDHHVFHPPQPPSHHRGKSRRKSGKGEAYLVRIVHCSPLSCKRFQKRKIQLKSFLSFHFLATFLCVLLQLKLSTGGLVPSAGLAAAATAWDRPADELEQLPPPNQLPPHTQSCAPPLKSTAGRTNFPPNWRRKKYPVFGHNNF